MTEQIDKETQREHIKDLKHIMNLLECFLSEKTPDENRDLEESDDQKSKSLGINFPLSDALFEFEVLENLLDVDEPRRDQKVSPYLLKLLVRGLKTKIYYYQEKYGFEVPDNDYFYTEDLLDLARKVNPET
ncbi:MAG: hypothetical protein JRH18_20005 [Deltaproteobacteria bacterium]|nr:hypothetical protein [Deltaproteobacteria bacterium]MBW2153936.1 hypothetical protein [Deltaproteobacteria bacterium]